MATQPRQRTYDHRLIRLVQETGDATIATGIGIPRSTVAGWLKRAPLVVTTAPGLDATAAALRVRVARLEKRLARLKAVLRLFFAVCRLLQPDLTRLRVPNGCDKARLLRAIDRSRRVLGLRRVLRIIGLSPSRLSAWRRAAAACDLDDRSACPRFSPHELTPEEVSEIRSMVTSTEFRHVPTGRLAVLAQRIGRVLASPSTWYRLVRERGWRRPRLRIHPRKPRVGIRAEKPNEIWHIDTTMIRLLDGARVYLHAVIDNCSRRILAWRLNDHFDPGMSADLLVEAGRGVRGSAESPTLLADAGVENRNRSVDELIESGLLRRVLAMTEIRFSNSLIEAWWRSLKHNWLYLNQLDCVARVRRLVAFYVEEHNTRLPHSVFRGQTPDEMYSGTGDRVPDALAAGKEDARRRRLEINRAAQCPVCA
jgi:putative transposase